MKRFLYIALSFFLAVSCTQEIEDIRSTLITEGQLAVDISVQVPEANMPTKGMADKPQLRNLYLAVFDQAGYLREYVQADLVTDATENGTPYSYRVLLNMSENPCTIHFIGNAPSTLKFGTEETVLNSIKATGGEDLYWYTRSLDCIAAIAADELVQADPYTQSMLTNVPLIRNFAKVVLNADQVSNFKLEKYTVVNALDAGFAAPYNSTEGSFVEYFHADGSPKTYAQLIEEGFSGFVPSTAEYISVEDIKSPNYKWVDLSDTDLSDDACYVYERETPVENPAYIIAYGTYTGVTPSKQCYYKIDLRDEDGEYFPLLRNFIYTISLINVEREGYSTIEDAAASSGTGDISTNSNIASLVYISDGKASLSVGYTEKVVVVDEDSPETIQVELPFEFIPDVKNSSNKSNSSVKIVKNSDYDTAGEAIKGFSRDDENGVITVELYSNTIIEKTQSLTLFATTPEGATLQRTVKYIVMQKPSLSAECKPSEVPDLAGQKFKLEITLPNGLKESMFPLDLEIEAIESSITPDNDHLPVRTGPSHANASKGAFYFIKTVTWKDYLASKTVVCSFKTNKGESATDIIVTHKYFKEAKAQLKNFTPKYFTELKFEPGVVSCNADLPVDFSFKIQTEPDGTLPNEVWVYISGAEPADDFKEKLTQGTDMKDGTWRYKYVPDTDEPTLKLQTINENSPIYVRLEADHFIPENDTAQRGDAMTATINRTISGEIGGFSGWSGNETQFTATISTNGAESYTATVNITRDGFFMWHTYEYSLTISDWNVIYTDDTQLVTITLVHRGNTYTGTCTLKQLIDGNVDLDLNKM